MPISESHYEIRLKGQLDTRWTDWFDGLNVSLVLFSTYWIIVMFNRLKADILSVDTPGLVEEFTRTSASAGESIPHWMLSGGIIRNLSIAMIIHSRGLKDEINRWVNIIVGILTIACIWVGAASYSHD